MKEIFLLGLVCAHVWKFYCQFEIPVNSKQIQLKDRKYKEDSYLITSVWIKNITRVKWLELRLSKRQLMSSQTDLLRTTVTRVIIIYLLMKYWHAFTTSTIHLYQESLVVVWNLTSVSDILRKGKGGGGGGGGGGSGEHLKYGKLYGTTCQLLGQKFWRELFKTIPEPCFVCGETVTLIWWSPGPWPHILSCPAKLWI